MDPLLPDSAVQVAVTDLNLRVGPCTSAQKLATLKRGTILIVYGEIGPFKGDGFPWYRVTLASNLGPDGQLPLLPTSPTTSDPYDPDVVGGWIAANDGSKPYLTQVAPRCPTTVNLQNVRGMLPAERLACFDAPFTLEGTFGCGGCGGSGGPIAKPYWLASTFEFDHFWVHWFKDEQPVSLHFRPSGPAKPPEGKIIRVVVHVDDPASVRCSLYWSIADPPYAVPDELVIPYCRERMVVESYEILGTDPDYR